MVQRTSICTSYETGTQKNDFFMLNTTVLRLGSKLGASATEGMAIREFQDDLNRLHATQDRMYMYLQLYKRQDESSSTRGKFRY